jgi:hypothetical protein
LLCGASADLSETDETVGIISAFLTAAVAVEGLTTYGTTMQRYEAAAALQRELDEMTGRPVGAPRYLVDSSTGEYIIRVGELQAAARVHIGSTLARGWLDARMQSIEWVRRALDGHAAASRGGRYGAHGRVHVYRGLLPHVEETDGD